MFNKKFSSILSLEEKIGQMLVVGFHGLEPPSYILRWLANGRIGGVILFARNIKDPNQVAELTRLCHNAAKYPILVAIDQEGGAVARLREGFSESPGAMALGAANSEKLAEEVSAVLATELKALGINWNLAPVLDVTHNINNPSVGVRSLSSDPERVASLGIAQVQGFQNAGVAATAKHFPGKAKTPIDPHVKLPVISDSFDNLWDVDLVPFRAAIEAGIAAVMVTHVQFTALDPKYPSTLSPRIIQGLLREDVGFDGLISTDCMEMKAVTDEYGPGESAVLAVLAGANIILFSHTREYQEEVYDTLLESVKSGRIPLELIDNAVEKIYEMKIRFKIYNQPSPDVIRNPNHLRIMEKAARSGTILLCNKTNLLPLNQNSSNRIFLIEFASHLEIEKLKISDKTLFASYLQKHIPDLKSLWINPSEPSKDSMSLALSVALSNDVLIIATRNAHLLIKEKEVAQELLNLPKEKILVCLRNPYDAGVLTGVDSIICTCGDSTPSLIAASDALVGLFSPTGILPVHLKGK